MSSGIPSSDEPAPVVERNDDVIQEKRDSVADEHVEHLKNEDAYAGENRQHAMGTWESFKAYPWACFWAFLMCFTIVSDSRLCRFARTERQMVDRN